MDDALAAVVVAAGCASVIYSLSGFGNAILFQCLWAIFALAGVEGTGGIPDAVVVTSITSTVVGWGQFYHLRGPAQRWDLAAWVALGQAPAIVAGYYALYAVHSRVLERCMGAVFLGVVLWKARQAYRERHKRPAEEGSSIADGLVHRRFDMRGWRRKLAALAVGGASGFLGGFIGCEGPALMVFVSVMGIDPQEWRATTSVLSLVKSAPQAAYLLAFKADIPADWALRFPLAALAAVGGLVLGNVLARFVPKGAIKWLIAGLLAFSGSLLLVGGDALAVDCIMVGFFLVAVVGAVWWAVSSLRHGQRPRGAVVELADVSLGELEGLESLGELEEGGEEAEEGEGAPLVAGADISN